VIVAFSVALRASLQLCFVHERNEIEDSARPIFYAAKLETGLEESRQEEIQSQISSIEGLAAPVHVETSIPVWHGEPEQEKQWVSMWKAYLSPILYATAENQISGSDAPPLIARQIREVTGVTQVVWNEEEYNAFRDRLVNLKNKESFFNSFFFFYLIAITAGLLSGYPVRFRRKYVVRTGLGGAGSQISPERIWLHLIAWHIASSVSLYAVLFTLVYLFFPLSLNTGSKPGFFALLYGGSWVVSGLVTAVCLIGWWFSAKEVQAVTLTRSSASEWNTE